MAKMSKKSRRGGGAGKERKRLPLSPDILPNAVRQRTGGNDVLPLVNRPSIKLIDQNEIRFPFIKDQNMAEAEENSYFECPFDFEFALEETTQLLLFAGRYVNSAETGANLRKGCASSFTDWFCQKCNFSIPGWCQREVV